MIRVGLVAGLWLGFLAAARLGEPALRTWCAKEGPVEWISVAVVVACCVMWAIALARRRAARRDPWPWMMLGFASLVLAEELDYGALVGIDAVASWLQTTVGRRNLHNLAGGHSYLVFALVPAIAVLVGLSRPRAQGLGPSRGDAVALLVAAAPSVVSTWCWPGWADELDEFGELALYVALTMWALRAVRPRR